MILRTPAIDARAGTARDMHGVEAPRPPRLRDDVAGGLVSAAVAVPLAMGYGMFAFVALGDAYFAHGALAERAGPCRAN